MRTASNLGRIVAIIIVAVVVGGLFTWWITRDTAPIFVTPSDDVMANRTNRPSPPQPNAGKTDEEIAAEMAEVPEPQQALTWSDKLDQILLSDGDENKKADKILELIKESPEDAQVELSQHLINLVLDENYTGTAELLTNSVTPAAVSSVLMNDLLNRNNTLKLPMLLEVAKNDQHPLKAEAKEMLELFIQEDNGTNWTQWQTSIETWLKENP